MNDSSASRLRLTCGLLASAARLVPVPLLDDYLRERAVQLMVSQTLRGHERTYGSRKVPALYGDASGCLQVCLVGVLQALFKLLLFPIKKVVVWVMAARNLARDLSEAILLGRALDRMLTAGRLANGASEGALRTEAAQIRLAFDNAVAGTDMKVLTTVLRSAVSSVRGLPRAALAALRSIRRGGGLRRGGGDETDPTDPTAGLSDAQKRTVEEGTDRIEEALSTPPMVAFLEAFDARFDENLGILEARARG